MVIIAPSSWNNKSTDHWWIIFILKLEVKNKRHSIFSFFHKEFWARWKWIEVFVVSKVNEFHFHIVILSYHFWKRHIMNILDYDTLKIHSHFLLFDIFSKIKYFLIKPVHTKINFIIPFDLFKSNVTVELIVLKTSFFPFKWVWDKILFFWATEFIH